MAKDIDEDKPEDIMDFAELQGNIWGWLAKYKIYKKDFDGNEQIIKSINYYFDWFIDRINELEEEDSNADF